MNKPTVKFTEKLKKKIILQIDSDNEILKDTKISFFKIYRSGSRNAYQYVLSWVEDNE